LVVEGVRGGIGVAEQFRLLGAQLDETRDEGARIRRIATIGAVDRRLVQPLANVATAKRRLCRLLGRVLEE
jgi:hypothetical protein